MNVNHRSAPKEQPQATGNQAPARETSDPEDEVVETSDNEELAFDHALQRPSYWLAPSLYAPYFQTAHSKPPCLSQHAIGSSSAQPATHTRASSFQTTDVSSALLPSRLSSPHSPVPETSPNTSSTGVDLWGYSQPPGDSSAPDSMHAQTLNDTEEELLQFPPSPSSGPQLMISSSQTPPLLLVDTSSPDAMEVDRSSTVEAVVQVSPRPPSINVLQKTRHQYSLNHISTPSLPPINLKGPDPLHLNSPLSPTTPPTASILGKRKRLSPLPSRNRFESWPQDFRAGPSGQSNSVEEGDEVLAKAMQATEEFDGGRRYSLRKRDGEFLPYTNYVRQYGREGKKLLDTLDKVERKKKRARLGENVDDSDEEYHQETQEESQTQRPPSRKTRSKSREPRRRSKESEQGRSKSRQYHRRPSDSPMYRPRAWLPPSPPYNPTKPVQEPIRRPNPQHDLSGKPRRFIFDDGFPVRGRVAGPPKVTTIPSPSLNRKDDTSDEYEPLIRGRSDQDRTLTQIDLQMGDVDSSEPYSDFNQPIADNYDESGSIAPRKLASTRNVQPDSDLDETEPESSSASEAKAEVSLDPKREMAKWSKEDHKRFAILKRTMPTTMCLKLMREAREKEMRKREEGQRKASVEDDEDEDEDEGEESQEVRPGHSKVRQGGGGKVTIVGDTESESDDDRQAAGRGYPPIVDNNSDVELLDDAVPDDLEEGQSVGPSHSRVSRSVSVRGAETTVEDNNTSNEDSESEVEFLGEAVEDNRLHGGYRVGMLKPRRLVQTRIDRMLNSTTARKGGGPARRQSKRRVFVDTQTDGHSHRKARRDLGSGITQSGGSTSRWVRTTSYSTPRITHGGGDDSGSRKYTPHHSTSEGIGLTIELDPVRQSAKKPAQSNSSHGMRLTKKRTPCYQQDLLHCLTGRGSDQNQIQAALQDPDNVAPQMKKPPTKQARRWVARSANIHIVAGGSSLTSKPISMRPYQTIEEPAPPARDDPDSSIHIARNSAKTFGMPRQLKNFSLPRDSFISQGRLLDLVKVLSGVRDPPRPDDCVISGLHLRAEMSLDDLQLSFPTCCDLLYEYALTGLEGRPEILGDPPEVGLMALLCGYTSWVARQGIVEDVKAFFEHLGQQLRQTMDRIEDKLDLQAVYGSDFSEELWKVHWFAVELTARMAYGGAAARRTTGGQLVVKAKEVDEEMERLMARLHEFGIRRAACAFKHDRENPPSKATRAMELWVSLIHITLLLPSDPNTEKEACMTFWRCVERSLETTVRVFPSPVHESEYGWSIIFGLSAISQIDARGRADGNPIRLQAHWPLVCKCMSRIQLAPNPEADKRLSRHILHDRDIYVGILFTRCHALVAKWGWSLVDSDILFAVLREALRHRNFENLGHESNDFPQFIVAKDLALLDSYNSFDSIQTVAIKLIVGRAKASSQGTKSAVKGLSSFASTNASATIFTKEKPPIRKELSRVFNRFTISFMMLHVDHNTQRTRSIIHNAKRFVDFRNADLESRKACIRAVMAFGLLLRYHDLPMDEVVKWMNEIGSVIIDDYKAFGRNTTKKGLEKITVLFGMLLGCSRSIAVGRGFAGDAEPEDVKYPTPSLCLIDFVAKVFRTHELLDLLSRDVLAYLEAWLDQRQRLIPPPSVPQFNNDITLPQEESQESYGFDPIDFNDPLLNAALQGATELGAPTSTGTYSTVDKDLAEKLLQLVPGVYQLVSRLAFMDGMQMDEDVLDAWLDCWSRLGGLMVRHGLRDWSYFLQQGPAALDRIGDRKWRRRAAPRFLLSVLKTDPNAYKDHERQFFHVWLSSLVVTRISHEHELTYWLFHIDGFRHPLLHAVPFDKSLGEDEYGRDEFLVNRLGIIDAVVKNLANRLEIQKEGHCSAETINENAGGLTAIEEMLQSMRDHYADLLPGFFKDEYGSLCHKVLATIEANGTLAETQRVASSLSWFKSRNEIRLTQGGTASGDQGT